MGLLFIFTAINELLIRFTSYGSDCLSSFIMGPLNTALTDREGVLITIAAIFIGIFFTVLTLLGNIKVESTFTILGEGNLKKLLKYIVSAFLGAFGYLFFALIAPISTSYPSIEVIISIISILLVAYMLLTAFRFGVIILFIFKKDMDNLSKVVAEEKQHKQHQKLLMHRLEHFLKNQEEIEAANKAKRVNEILESRKDE